MRRRSAFRALCGAALVSEVGDWLLFIALPLYVLNASGSPLDTSEVFLAELIPAVIIGTTCGPLIDRRSASRLLTCLTAAEGLVVVPLLWAEPGQVWLICAVAAMQAAFTSLTTPALQAVVPTIVDRPVLTRANAIIEMAGNVARLVGSPLGGALLPVVGLHGLVVGDIGSFVIAAALLSRLPRTRIRLDQSAAASPGGPFVAIVEGAQAVRRSSTLGAALVISFVSSVAQGLFLVLFVLFVLRSLHAGDELVGLLRGVQAIGGILGGLLVAGRLRRSSPRSLAVWGLGAFAWISALSWNSPELTTSAWWYVILFALVGIPATMLGAGLITGVQEASRPDLRGRILSLLTAAEAVGQATGILAAGLLSGLTSLTLLLNAQAGCYLACAFVALAFFARAPTGAAQRRRAVESLRHARTDAVTE